jgi:phage minor structural protein
VRVIVNEFYKTIRVVEDYSTGIYDNLVFSEGSLGIAEVRLKPDFLRGEWRQEISLPFVESNKSRFFWNAELIPNTTIKCFIIQDAIETELVNGEGVLEVHQDFTIKIVFERQDIGTISPVLHDFNIAVWQEISNTDLEIAVLPKNVTQDLLKMYNLQGELVAFLENADDIVTEEILFAQELLSFNMPYTDWKTQLINYDGEVVYKNKRYAITDIQDGIDDSGKYIYEVTCELVYVELLNKTIVGEFVVDLKTIREGAEMILKDTTWTVGQIDVDETETFSMLEVSKTSLWYIYTWATITGTEVEWNSLTREVNFVSRAKEVKKTFFRYGHNLKSIKRKIVPPKATVIYPYGKNGLNISTINLGLPYLEDYSWYTEQGISIETARKYYKKEMTFEDDRFLMMLSLKNEANRILSELSRPQISYECKVQDLSGITGSKENSFKIGDMVKVFNDDLNINVETRIVKLKKYHLQEWKNEIELGVLQEGLEHSQNTSGVREQVQSSQPSVIFAINETAGVTVRTQTDALLRLRYSSFGSTHGQVGLSMVGEVSNDCLLTIRFMIASTIVSQIIKQQLKAGWNTVGVPLLFTDLPEGTNNIDVEMSVSVGTINVPQKNLQMYMFANNLLGGGIGEQSAPAPQIIQHFADFDARLNQNMLEIKVNTYQRLFCNPRVPIIRRSIVQNISTNIEALDNDGIINNVTIALTKVV